MIWRMKPYVASANYRRQPAISLPLQGSGFECRRRGIVRLDVGAEAVAATFLPGRLRKSRARSLQRDGDRVVYTSKDREGALRKVEEFLDALDE